MVLTHTPGRSIVCPPQDTFSNLNVFNIIVCSKFKGTVFDSITGAYYHMSNYNIIASAADFCD